MLFFQSECKEGWLEFGQSCYWFSIYMQSLPASQKVCQNMNSHLVSIQSNDEHDFIINHRPDPTKDTWIGLHRDTTNLTVWKWSSGEDFQYTNWADGEPNYEIEECASIHGSNYRVAGHENLWNDYGCGASYRFVCEQQL